MKKIVCIFKQELVVRTSRKILKTNNKPLLLNLYERISKVYIDKIVIATTKLKNDREIVKICKKIKLFSKNI